MIKYYAGIGSRNTPESARGTIRDIVAFLYQEGYTLRSGGAPGADEMFETALKELLPETHKQYKEIYVPWYCFNSSTSPLCRVSEEAIAFSLQYHPNPSALNLPAQKIMGRNAYQVLGQDLKTKSDFLVCWTENGADSHSTQAVLNQSGGTGQAMRIARAHDVKIFNIKSGDDFRQWYSDNNFDIM